MKRIVICCDGTWNNPEQKYVTNVVKIARAVRVSDADGAAQILFYDWGVGSEGRGDRFPGGAFGAGLDKNIQDGYRFLVHNYAAGDEIFLFGFSRGAYTARSIAGLIRNAGILHKKHSDKIPAAYRMYRTKAKPDVPSALRFRQDYSHARQSIKFVGVWDTVGALGIPLRIMRDGNQRKYSFHDTTLSRLIENGFHAAAIDERRLDFKPALWSTAPRGRQHIEQMWFVGVHCDVGGGYEEKGLSDCAFQWMIEKAKICGLAFDDTFLDSLVTPDAQGKIHKSYRGVYWLKGQYVRPIGRLHESLEKIHSSVMDRYQTLDDYRPVNLVSYVSDR
jgi:uncharacterized protein (DUF2235 family)